MCKERKKQEIADELYREEQKSKYIKESIREEFASRKKRAESFQEIVMLESPNSILFTTIN